MRTLRSILDPDFDGPDSSVIKALAKVKLILDKAIKNRKDIPASFNYISRGYPIVIKEIYGALKPVMTDITNNPRSWDPKHELNRNNARYYGHTVVAFQTWHNHLCNVEIVKANKPGLTDWSIAGIYSNSSDHSKEESMWNFLDYAEHVTIARSNLDIPDDVEWFVIDDNGMLLKIFKKAYESIKRKHPRR